MRQIARSLAMGLSVAVLGSLFQAGLRADVTAEQRNTIREIRTTITKAGNLFKTRKFQDSGKLIKQAQAEFEKLAEGAETDLINQLAPVHKQLSNAHALLELEGVTLNPLKKLGEKPETPEPAAGGLSFTKQVAPILVAKCGRCHVTAARGEFSMANYASLMKGSSAGVVLFAGDADGSRMIELIENGDMPRGGLKVTADEKATLKQWINAGAKYDGEDPQLSLTRLSNTQPGETVRLEVMKSTGKETISFSSDIAAILNEQCADCHGNGRRPSGRFNLTTFEGLLRGGESGAPIVPGKPAESLLIKKLLGTGGGQRMPRGRDPLSASVMAKIEKWIQEGATFDGPDAGQHIRQVAALARAEASSHEELSAARATAADENWKLGMPGIESQRAETKNFLVLGNAGANTLGGYGETAETLAPKVADVFKAASDEPLIKGRMTLYVFTQRYDYSEFGKMVEKRQIPREWRGHWRFNVVDAYAAMIPPRGDEYSLEGLLAEQIAGTYVASLGSSPRWFSEGSGRVAASRLYPEDPRVLTWNESLPAVLSTLKSAEDFLAGKVPPDAASVANYHFVRFLMKDAKRYDALLKDLRNGETFTASFSRIYGGSPAQLADRWARTASR